MRTPWSQTHSNTRCATHRTMLSNLSFWLFTSIAMALPASSTFVHCALCIPCARTVSDGTIFVVRVAHDDFSAVGATRVPVTQHRWRDGFAR